MSEQAGFESHQSILARHGVFSKKHVLEQCIFFLLLSCFLRSFKRRKHISCDEPPNTEIKIQIQIVGGKCGIKNRPQILEALLSAVALLCLNPCPDKQAEKMKDTILPNFDSNPVYKDWITSQLLLSTEPLF